MHQGAAAVHQSLAMPGHPRTKRTKGWLTHLGRRVWTAKHWSRRQLRKMPHAVEEVASGFLVRKAVGVLLYLQHRIEGRPPPDQALAMCV